MKLNGCPDSSCIKPAALLQQEEFMLVRLAMEEGISKTYMDNDMILLSKDDPNVGRSSAVQAVPAI